MPDDARTYFDNLYPVKSLPDALIKLNAAWVRLNRTVAVTGPRALDRCRVWRNRFDNAVR